MFLRSLILVKVGIKSVPYNALAKVLTLFAMLVIWCCFLRMAFGDESSFAIYMDNEFLIGPILSSISNSLSAGELPLRMDTVLGGVPLYNATQLSAFYPFYFAWLPIYETTLGASRSLHLITLGHIFLLQLNMYIFLRVSGTSRLAALTGAVLVAFSGNTLIYSTWINIVAPYSWLPLYLAGLIGILTYPEKFRYCGLAVIGIIFLTLASPAQPLIHAVLVTLVFLTSFGVAQLRAGKAKDLLPVLLRISCVAIVALLLVAPVLFPPLFEFKNMIRWIGNFPAVIGNQRIPFEAFQVDKLNVEDLLGVLFKFKGAHVGQQFVGVLAIVLSGAAIIFRYRSWLVIALFFIGIYSLISSTGSSLGLGYVNYEIPFLNKIREPSRFLVLFQFSIAALTAFGVDQLYESVDQKRHYKLIIYFFGALLLVALMALITTYFTPELLTGKISPFVSVLILAAIILLTLIAFKSNLQLIKQCIPLVWCGLLLVIMLIEIPWKAPLITTSDYLSKGSLSLDLAIARVSDLDPERDYRLIFEGHIDKQKAAMLSSYQGVRTLNSYFNPAPYQQFREVYYHGGGNSSISTYFRNLGAKYVICDDCANVPSKNYDLYETYEQYKIYQSKDALPNSYITHWISGEYTSFGDYLAKVELSDLDKRGLFVQPNSKVDLTRSPVNSDLCIKRQNNRSANYREYIIQCDISGVFVMNEFFDTSWKVSVNGVDENIVKVNGNQIGVYFPSGTHVLKFWYYPKVFFISMYLALVGFICLFIAFIIIISLKGIRIYFPTASDGLPNIMSAKNIIITSNSSKSEDASKDVE